MPQAIFTPSSVWKTDILTVIRIPHVKVLTNYLTDRVYHYLTIYYTIIVKYYQFSYTNTMEPKKLYRSRDNKVFTGLSAGIAKYFGVDPTLVRVLLVIAEFATAGLLIFVYLLIAFFVPKEP